VAKARVDLGVGYVADAPFVAKAKKTNVPFLPETLAAIGIESHISEM
jgi:hypothetical protein